MRSKKIFFSITLLLISISIFAQDSLLTKEKFTHSFGFQANQLIRQVFNFSNNNPNINSPYLLTYTLSKQHSKNALDFGIGYNFNNTTSNDGNTQTNSNINDLSARIGYQRKITISPRFSSTFNVHVVCDVADDKTINTQNFNGEISEITTKTNNVVFGLGPCLGIQYRLNKKMQIGTEANYYYKMGKSKTNAHIYQVDVNSGTVFNDQTTYTNNDVKSFIFNVPTAIYLIINF